MILNFNVTPDLILEVSSPDKPTIHIQLTPQCALAIANRLIEKTDEYLNLAKQKAAAN